MVVFDATILIVLLYPDAPPPRHPDTNDPVDRFRDRIDYLVSQIEKSRDKIIIPTPALSEILVRADEAAPKYLAKVNTVAVFRFAPFDKLAAVEVAAMTRGAIDTTPTRNRKGYQDGTWAKIKYDRQIVAIAKVNGAAVIYSDDGEIFKLGREHELTVIRTADLPLPPEDAQMKLNLPPRKEGEDGEEGGKPKSDRSISTRCPRA